MESWFGQRAPPPTRFIIARENTSAPGKITEHANKKRGRRRLADNQPHFSLPHMEEHRDADTWKTNLTLYGPKLLLCARLWTRSFADAEDVVQDAFVRYWRLQRNLPGEPLALLLTSVRRAALDLARREGRRAVREEQASSGTYDYEGPYSPPLLEQENKDALEDALRRLPPPQREVLVLKIWGELTFEQISTELTLPPGTVASRYRAAIAALREHLTTPVHE
jgi:RNA polymerase sigma-70 factor (ECF subfamily)